MSSRPSIFHHWKAKLGSLALAIVLWFVIHQSVKNAAGPLPPTPPAAEAIPRE